MSKVKKKSVADTLKGIEERLGIEEGLGQDEAGVGAGAGAENELSSLAYLESEADLAASRAISTLPPVWEDCYAKVYKIRPLPPGSRPPVLMGHIADMRDVRDMELHLRELAWYEGWGSGTYKIGIFKNTSRGQIPQHWQDIEIQVPKDTPPPRETQGSGNGGGTGHLMPTPAGSADFLSQVQQYSALSKAFQDAVPKMADPVSLADQQMRMFQSGIELAKGQLTPQQQQNPLELVMQLVKLGLVQVPGQGVQLPQTPPPPDILTMLRTLKELLPPPAPVPIPADPWEGLRKLTELGILDPRKKEEDTLGSLDKVVNLFTTLAPILGGGGEKTTATTELIRTIGPQTGEIVGKITDTVNNVVSFGKEKLRMRLGVGASVPSVPLRVPPPVELPTFTPHYSTPVQDASIFTGTTPTPTPLRGDLDTSERPSVGTSVTSTDISIHTNRNPIIDQILSAVRKGDTEFYPQLQELMTVYLNPQIVEQLLSGAVFPDTLLTSLANMTQEPELAGEDVKAYLRGFLEWHGRNTVVVRCTGTCKEEYEVVREEWEADIERTCDECGGNLVEESNATYS